MLPNSNNRFLDKFLTGLAHEQSVTDSIVKVVWRDAEKDPYGLVRFSPRSSEAIEDLKVLLVSSLEELAEDETFKFRCSGQVVKDESGYKSLVLRVWEPK